MPLLRSYHISFLTSFSQPNLCDSDLHAVDHANKKRSANYNATGVGGVVCARHTLVRKNGLGDLQKGERYVHHSIRVSYSTRFLQLC
jgi:hypothetical protein